MFETGLTRGFATAPISILQGSSVFLFLKTLSYKSGTAFHLRSGPWDRLPHSEQNFDLHLEQIMINDNDL